MKKEVSFFLTLLVTVLYFLFEANFDIEEKETPKKDEKYYQTKMCRELDGKIEYILFDKTRVDCLTHEYAVEVDFAKKWAEGIGQALYYAEVTGKKPSVGLIVGDGDRKYLDRLQRVADKFDIKVIVIDR